VFRLPSLGFELRHIAIDNHAERPNVWVASYRTGKVARLQFRTDEEVRQATH
jgi:hypothetical protein